MFGRPVPELTAVGDLRTLAAIEVGIATLDAGFGVGIEEVRRELARRLEELSR